MAKIDEKDPRWLVENRKDGRNVGNFHWEEKNLIPWSKQKLEELFKDVEIEQLLKITALDKVSGDSVINLRKGRTILIYDLEVTLKWGSKDPALKVEGEIKLWDITSENGNEFQYQVTTKEVNAESEDAKQIMQTAGKEVVKQKIIQFLQEMKTIDVGIPTADILETAQKIRVTGNDHFKNERYQQAIVEYDKAIQTLHSTRPNANDKVEVDQSKISCYINRATCNIKLANYREAIVDCTKAIELDGNAVKALYKRSQAYCFLKEFKESQADIALALKLEPNNKDVQQQHAKVNQRAQLYKKKQQQKMGGIFKGDLYSD